jgi:hypothetical protein
MPWLLVGGAAYLLFFTPQGASLFGATGATGRTVGGYDLYGRPTPGGRYTRFGQRVDLPGVTYDAIGRPITSPGQAVTAAAGSTATAVTAAAAGAAGGAVTAIGKSISDWLRSLGSDAPSPSAFTVGPTGGVSLSDTLRSGITAAPVGSGITAIPDVTLPDLTLDWGSGAIDWPSLDLGDIALGPSPLADIYAF